MTDPSRVRLWPGLVLDRALTIAEGIWLRSSHRAMEVLLGDRRRAQRTDAPEPDLAADYQRAMDAGVEPGHFADVVSGVLARGGDLVASSLARRRAQMLREHRIENRGFRRRLNLAYGPGLDLLYSVYVCMEEVGSELQTQYSEASAQQQVMLGLHARACLLVLETHAMLASGLPLGAWARARTLHETAVTMAVLAEYGLEPQHDDLAERFLAYGILEHRSDVRAQVEAGGGDEEDVQLLAELDAECEQLLHDHGTELAVPNGWARPLFPHMTGKAKVTLRQLEELADAAAARYEYRIASHHVHASGRSIDLNTLYRAGQWFRLTGPTNAGLVEPAAFALEACIACVTSLVHGLDQGLPSLRNLIAVRTIGRLAVDASEAFVDGDHWVAEREQRLQPGSHQ